ncbi:MAG: aspartyl protease family protein [Paracoccaceae bacterium]|jgi:aspartyl protease family protein
MFSLAFRLAMMGAGLFLLNALFPQALTATDHMARLAYFSILFLIVVSSAALPRLDRGRSAESAILVWAGAFAALVAGYAWEDDLRAMLDQRLGMGPAMAAVAHTPRTVQLQRTSDGHFRAMVESNGVAAPFLVDTGASLVLIRWEDAGPLGIDIASLRFITPVATANGQSMVAPVRLLEVKIGDLTVSDVRAAVAPPGALKGGLLGMSFLNRLDEITIRGDRITLKN